MAQYLCPPLDLSFAALSDATRRGIIDQLGRGDASITSLADKFQMTLTGMKKHVRVLERAGLVVTKKLGRVRTCKLGKRGLEAEAAKSLGITNGGWGDDYLWHTVQLARHRCPASKAIINLNGTDMQAGLLKFIPGVERLTSQRLPLLFTFPNLLNRFAHDPDFGQVLAYAGALRLGSSPDLHSAP